jgi:hypothetical protein
LPANEPRKALLGKWSSTNAWASDEPDSRAANRYQAVTWSRARARGMFTVSRHGNRWYLSAGAGARVAISLAGFESPTKRTGGLQPRRRADPQAMAKALTARSSRDKATACR